MLDTGTAAPTFTLGDHKGDSVSLEEFKGSWVVLWWYPKADTPGCTIEGQTYRDLTPEFTDVGAVIFGISFDDTDANCTFAKNHDFTYRLLSDVDHTVSEAYHASKPAAPGEERQGWARRVSYLIDPDGMIAKSYKVDDIMSHPGQVLADIKELQASRA